MTTLKRRRRRATVSLATFLFVWTTAPISQAFVPSKALLHSHAHFYPPSPPHWPTLQSNPKQQQQRQQQQYSSDNEIQEDYSDVYPRITPRERRNKRTSASNSAETASSSDHNSNSPFMSWWLNLGGRGKRGTNQVIMREAAALGGLPRSDRYSSKDWFHNTVTLPNSTILQRIRSPVLSMSSWATVISILHALLPKYGLRPERLHISTAPHSLMMSALGLLLVFRTNSAYQRFAEGRKIWELIVNSSRDLYRGCMLYSDEIGVDKRRRLQKLIAAFPYFLRHRIRPNLVMRRLDDEQYTRDPENTILLYQDSSPVDTDPEAAVVAQAEEETGKGRRKTRTLYYVDKRTLPWRLLPSPESLEKCARAQNRPLWVCDRMAAEIRQVPDGPHFSARERLALIGHVNSLSRCIGGVERIHQTVVPLNYSRHTLRALTLWLLSLPFALVKDLQLATGPMVFLVSWLLFGVYEIGYSIEDPFQGSLRLSILCDGIRRDVLADERIRSSAFELEGEEHDPVVGVVDKDDDDDDNDGAINGAYASDQAQESFLP